MRTRGHPSISISITQKTLDDKKEDLSRMKSARQHIADIINAEQIQDDEVFKKLNRIDKQIEKIEKMINDYQVYIDSINNAG